jgi:hypothetical protein
MTMRGLFAALAMAFAVMAVSQAGDSPRVVKDKDVKKMEFTGTLRTGIAAIGGETTGTIIQAKKDTFELERRLTLHTLRSQPRHHFLLGVFDSLCAFSRARHACGVRGLDSRLARSSSS